MQNARIGERTEGLKSVPIALCSLLLFGYMALTDLFSQRLSAAKAAFCKQKTVPERSGFRLSPPLLYVVLRIRLRACIGLPQKEVFAGRGAATEQSCKARKARLVQSGVCYSQNYH